jgi:hypothetical protein
MMLTCRPLTVNVATDSLENHRERVWGAELR